MTLSHEPSAAVEEERNPPQSSSERSLRRSVLRAVLVFLVVPYLAITVLFTVLQRRLVYHPAATPPLMAADHGFSSAAARDVTVSTADNLQLHGWLLECDDPMAGGVDPDLSVGDDQAPLVIYFPGNASHRGGRVNDLRDFTRLGCHVLIVDYRGYAENGGTPTEQTLTADAREVWRYAVEELEFDPGRIILFGESLGGAVAVCLATGLCEAETPPAALITNATFDSMPSLAGYHYPLFPFRWLVWDRWSSVLRISDVTCPLLMFHGTDDQLIPIAHGRRLFEAAPPRSLSGCSKCFVEIQAAGHNDIPVHMLEGHVRRLLADLRPGADKGALTAPSSGGGDPGASSAE